jgi:hypothetical protein
MLTPKGIADTLSGILPSLGPLAGAIETQTRASPDTIAKVKMAMDGVTSGIAAIGSAESVSDAGGEIGAVGGECERFGQAAAGIGQGHAEGAHQAVGTLGLAEEPLTLASGDVFPGTIGGVEPQASRGVYTPERKSLRLCSCLTQPKKPNFPSRCVEPVR